MAAARQFSTDADSHDDFKPQVKGAASEGVEATIEKDIASHDVFIYMKVGWAGWWMDGWSGWWWPAERKAVECFMCYVWPGGQK